METSHALSVLLIFPFFLFFSNPFTVLCRDTPDIDRILTESQLQSYIIQVRPPIRPMDAEIRKIWYGSFLPDAGANSGRLLHSYSEVFNGFAARLTEEDLQNLATKDGFLRAFPDRTVPLLTTRSPEFLGLKTGRGIWNASSLGKGVIIGLIDSGLTPGHPSFSDDGMPPPPAKWKGSCNFETGCNNKLIGAKTLISGHTRDPPSDDNGHGTHTASTAAGNFVADARYFGLAGGTAAGVAPHAHLAMYKVCDVDHCRSSDIVAGIDAAVSDGVDVISMSLGGYSMRFDEDPLSIAAFAAVQKGVFFSCAGGNNGPIERSLTNEAPWLLTVAATTTDRNQRVTVKLGDGHAYEGESVDQGSKIISLPLVYLDSTDPSCLNVERSQVEGKVVVCIVRASPEDISSNVKSAGGAGVILIDSVEGKTLLDDRCDFPAAKVAWDDGTSITSYATPATDATVSIISQGSVLGTAPAPVVAYFSSRGPSQASPGILKPDISGPGVNILAAWPPGLRKRNSGAGDKSFEILSGTSMSTPHLSGVAALLKNLHPNWSPAAIKSAIMTTSDDKDKNGDPLKDEHYKDIGFFGTGAGQVNPSKAADPGLVYDLSTDDYISYICGLYGDSGAQAIVHDRKVNCADAKAISEAELNYPSIHASVTAGASVSLQRTVTNVGPKNSTYTVQVEVPESVFVEVKPQTLTFSKLNEKQGFMVSVRWLGCPPSGTAHVDGNLRWVSETHVVRSALVVSMPNASCPSPHAL